MGLAQKFVNDKRIRIELGDFSSPASMAASPIYQRAGLVQLSCNPEWTPAEKLIGGGETGAGQFGAAVGLSGDGAHGLVGAPNDNAGFGGVWGF